MIRKHPFLIFCAIITVLVTAALTFIQSAYFAHIVKDVVAQHLPTDLGVKGDFSELSIGLFPPSIAIKNPQVVLGKQNLINLPAGSSITAQRIDLRFQLFQMLSGKIRVHEVAIVDGDMKLILHAKEMKKSPGSQLKLNVNWDELLQVRAEAVAIENTKIHLEAADTGFTADLVAERLRLAQWRGRDGLGYELRADLKDINSSILKDYLPADGISRISAVAHVNAAGALIDDILTVSDGLELRASGTIKGNLLADKNLELDSRVNLNGDVETIAGYFKLKTPLGVAGHVKFNGRLKGNLSDLVRTARADGKLDAQNVKYQAWSADQVVVQASYTGLPKGGEFAVSDAQISSREIPRVGGNQPGHGGKIEIGAFKYEFGEARQPFNIPIKFERVHAHWLGAGILKSIYALDFRMSGPVNATFVPTGGPTGKSWDVQANVNLDADGFQLDNQRYGEVKPLHNVFNVAKLNLNGPLIVNANGLQVNSLVLSMPRTHLVVTGGISPKTGYDLYGKGPANLNDFGQIAENPILGDGSLSVHAHGPGSRVIVDIDTDLKGAYYVGLKFGDMKGRITWDDDPSNLIFSQVEVQKGDTPYTVDGKISFQGENSISMNVVFPSGNVHDVTSIFENLTNDLWWFPSSLSGPIRGTATISGGLALSKMSILSELVGSGWQLVGERFQSVVIHGGYVKGAYVVSDLRATKQTGKIFGKLTYDADKKFDWDIKTQGMIVTDFDHLARLDVPFRGKIQLESTGHGKESTLQSVTLGSLSEFSVRGVPLPASQISIRTDGGVAVAKAVALGGQGIMDTTYNFNAGGASSFRTEFRHLDFSPALLLLNPSLMQDPKLDGYITGELKLNFKSGEIEQSTGEFSVQEYHLEKTGALFQLIHPVDAKIANGDFDIRELGIAGNGNNFFLNLHGKPKALNGTVTGDLDLSILEFLTPTIGKGSGIASLGFTIEGLLKEPVLFGQVDVDNGTLKIPSIDSPLENITGTLSLSKGVVTVENVIADLGGGRLTTSGTVALFATKYPTLNLQGKLAGNRVRIFPFQFIKVHGDLNVAGEERPYLVSGSLIVDSGMIREKILGQKQILSAKNLQYSPSSSGKKGTSDSDVPLFKLKIDVNAERGIFVDNDLFSNAEFKAHVTVVNTLDAPSILGSAEFVQGKMVFKDRIFQVQSAGAKFENPVQVNPSFNLTAVADIGNTKVQLYASGTKDNLKLEFTSTPTLSEPEILSLLALGGSGTQAFQYNPTNSSQSQTGEAASLILQSMDFNRDFQDKTGFEILLDESINPLQGLSIFNSKAPTEQTAEPKIIVKRRVGERLTLSYGSTVGVGTDKQSNVNAEYALTPGLSVIGVYENYVTQDIDENLDTQTSYGLDLKLQKRFK
jgi:hypothetical protein